MEQFNKRMVKVSVIFFFLLALATIPFFCNGCASLQGMDRQYLVARTQFNDEVARYLEYYDAAPPEQQAIYKESIDPLILEAEKALDAWGLALGLGSGSAEMSNYLDAKNAMIDALAELYGKE